jgi:hypothetical protein
MIAPVAPKKSAAVQTLEVIMHVPVWQPTKCA